MELTEKEMQFRVLIYQTMNSDIHLARVSGILEVGYGMVSFARARRLIDWLDNNLKVEHLRQLVENWDFNEFEEKVCKTSNRLYRMLFQLCKFNDYIKNLKFVNKLFVDNDELKSSAEYFGWNFTNSLKEKKDIIERMKEYKTLEKQMTKCKNQ